MLRYKSQNQLQRLDRNFRPDMAPASFRVEPLDVSVQIPYHFRCPISLELMRDPVTVATGQTYDRPSIDSWVATGNTTCPVTRSPLTDFTLIPNHTLRRLIQEWCVAHRQFGVERIPTPKQPPDPSLVRHLLSQSSAANSTHSLRLSALRRLRALARESDKNRSVIKSAHPDARRILLEIAFSGSAELSHESLAVLACFPLAEAECAWVASCPDRLAYLAGSLFHPSIDVRVNAAALVETVVSGTRSPELRYRVSNVDEIFEGLVDLVRSPVSEAYPRAVKIGVKALFALCLVKQTRHKAVGAGAAEAMIERLAVTEEKGEAERALATAELLCRVPEGCAALAGHALTVEVLVKMMLKVSDRATEYATGALLAVCSAEEKCQGEAVAAGVLTQLLVVVQSECTERAKRKAQLLLKLLRDSWPEFYSMPNWEWDDQNYACTEVLPF